MSDMSTRPRKRPFSPARRIILSVTPLTLPPPPQNHPSPISTLPCATSHLDEISRPLPGSHSRRRSIQTRRAAAPNMVRIRVEAHVLPAAKGLATARTEQLDLDRPGVRLLFDEIPLRDRRLGQAHEQRLKGVRLRGALGRVAEAPAAVGREDGGLVKVWMRSGQSGCDAGY